MKSTMLQEISNYLEKFDPFTQQRFNILYELVYKSTSEKINEKLWAKLPSFYLGNNYIRIIPFNDHINIEAASIIDHRDELCNYKITPRGMLKIYHNQLIPEGTLNKIFKQSLER